MKNNEFLAKQPVGKLLFKLSIPTVLAQLINMLYNVVDRIFIGHMDEIGDLALTGVGVCLPLIMIVSAFAALINSGGAPRASIFMGKKDNETAEKILGNCLSLQIIISIILTVILLMVILQKFIFFLIMKCFVLRVTALIFMIFFQRSLAVNGKNIQLIQS